VTLERALMRASVVAGRKDWSNQVPVVSGIAGARAYKRQAIDLVHRLPDVPQPIFFVVSSSFLLDGLVLVGA
jgi:hypothetical protein